MLWQNEAMTPAQVLDLAQMAVFTLLSIAAPVMFIALSMGLLIALFQALTSIQEMTLTFVPKILLVFISLLFLLPWMGDRMMVMTQELFTRIAQGGGPVT